MRVASEERSRGTGFMLRLKRRWDQTFPDKSHVSEWNLRDNATRFKKELLNTDTPEETEHEHGQENTLNNKWTDEMKVNLLRIDERERKKGRGVMKRMKDEWDEIYGNNQMSTQTLRDNTVRFHKDKLLLNPIEVRDGEDVDPEVVEPRPIEPNGGDKNINMTENVEVDGNVGEGENNEENLENENEEDENTRILKMRFEDILATPTPTMKENISDRERGMKLKKGVPRTRLTLQTKSWEGISTSMTTFVK